MKLYCPTCGGGTNYSLEKPKFCASCGKSFSLATRDPLGSKVVPRKQRAPIVNSPQESQGYKEEETFEIPDIEKLHYDLHASTQFSVVQLDKIAGTSKEIQGDGYVREADPTYSTESINEDFKRDAGSSRTSNVET
jgi:hypothetical protein